jgi:hypothetical protein
MKLAEACRPAVFWIDWAGNHRDSTSVGSHGRMKPTGGFLAIGATQR